MQNKTCRFLLITLLAACGNDESDQWFQDPSTAPATPTSIPASGGPALQNSNSILKNFDAGLPPTTAPGAPFDAGAGAAIAATASDASGATGAASGTPRFAPLAQAGQTDELLTYMAHLYGQPLGNGAVMHTVSDIGVINPSKSATTVLLNAHLQGYSTPGSTSVALPASRTTVAPALDLTFDFQALYRISAPVTATLALSLTAPGNPAPLDVLSNTVLIYPKNTIFWSKTDEKGNSLDFRHSVAVFVTPHDQGRGIDQLLKEASAHSSFGAMIGYQYMNQLEKPVSWTGTAQPGYCQFGTTTLTAGSQYKVSATSTCPSCTLEDGYLQVYTQTDWQDQRQKPLAKLNGLGKGSTTFTAATTEAHVVAACTPSSATGNRSYTFGLTPTFDATMGAYDQTAAIFLALKARGLNYVNVASDFFTGAQNVKYPAESLATKSANCIDGALIVASALESMGMRPGIVFVPGHATVAVLVEPNADPCNLANWLPMETTMIGTSTPMAAVDQDIKNVMPKVSGVLAKGCTNYKPNASVLIDIESMRDAGLRPAPM